MASLTLDVVRKNRKKSGPRSLEMRRFLELLMLLRKERVIAHCRAYQRVFHSTQGLRDILKKWAVIQIILDMLHNLSPSIDHTKPVGI